MAITGQGNIIILPTYNEIDNLPNILPKIWAVLPDTHILVVDDNSPDGTGSLADSLAEHSEQLFVLHRTEKKGLGPAYIAGFQWALQRDYQSIFEMDADLSHQPQHLPIFLHALYDYDIVLGCRYMPGGGVKGWARHRQWLSKFGNFYAKRLLNLHYRDLTGGFKCFSKRALEQIDFSNIQTTGYAFQIEVTNQAHHRDLSIGEVPIVFIEREDGVSKMSWNICVEAIRGVWTMRQKSRS